jgi:hypothetical protein
MYMSIMFGRPRFLRDDDIDQEYPKCINDEQLESQGVVQTSRKRDCLMIAPIQHAKLARIVSRAMKEQYAIRRTSNDERIVMIRRCNSEIMAWQESLPPFLSGAIHPSSLIVVLQRQATVLRLAKAHAIMLINRPLLVRKPPMQDEIRRCLLSAKDVVEHLMEAFTTDQVYSTFWLAQVRHSLVDMYKTTKHIDLTNKNFKYIAFNAVSILFIYVIQCARRQITPLDGVDISPQHLIIIAGRAQECLANASNSNAPSLRYSIILKELQQRAAQDVYHQSAPDDINEMSDMMTPESPSFDGSNLEPPLDPAFWLQLDSLPLCKKIPPNHFTALTETAFFNFPEDTGI